jgi:hypothetical protein
VSHLHGLKSRQLGLQPPHEDERLAHVEGQHRGHLHRTQGVCQREREGLELGRGYKLGVVAYHHSNCIACTVKPRVYG